MSGLKEETCEGYTYKIKSFLNTINKEANEITLDDILEFLRELRYKKEYSIGTVNNYRNAIKYFYEVVLEKHWIGKKIPKLKGYKPLPSVLSKEEVIEFIELIAMPAITVVLHTRGQNLEFHPHIHMIISAGGLTADNKWRKSSEKLFIPVKVLSKVFRGKFMSYLKENYKNDELSFYGQAEEYKNINKFKILVNKLYSINWYSYVKRPFNNADAIIEYLARYTHKIAITNSRIVKVEDGKVFFKYKDYKENSKQKVMSLDAVEFIRRFLMHVLPFKFVKIRYYGINANRNKKTKLKLGQKLTNILNNPLYKS